MTLSASVQGVPQPDTSESFVPRLSCLTVMAEDSGIDPFHFTPFLPS